MSTDKASGHTPGPWRVAESGVRDVGGYICFINKPTHYADQEERYAREVEERKANAQLICAAPDMLAALKRMIASFDFHDELHAEDGDDVSKMIEFGEAENDCRAAIAKAEQP